MLNIGGADPMQGFDVGVWVTDSSNPGNKVLMGQFTSIVVTVRNATEAYIEFGQRYPRYLDGEFQIAFVLEKGLLDMNVFQQTFGFKHVTRRKRFGRSPRFDITFAVNPVDADVLEGSIASATDEPLIDRDATGRFILEQCKVDSWHFASTSGRQVVATQWQGVAEGFAAVTSDYSEISGLTTPGLKGGPSIGATDAFYRSYPDGIASTTVGAQSGYYLDNSAGKATT
jgi:hypothetical protein